MLPIPVDNKERRSHQRQGDLQSADVTVQKRIPAKDRLGPPASYADLLRVPATQQQVSNGKPLPSQIQILKDTESSEIPRATIQEDGKAKV